MRPTCVRICEKLASRQRMDSVLLARWTYTVRTHAQRKQRSHAEKIQRMNRVLLARGTNGRACGTGHALEARWVCTRCALCVRQTSADVCATWSLDLTRRTCMLRVCLALVQRALRMSGVLLASTFCAHLCACTRMPTHRANDYACIALVQRAQRMRNEC